MKHVSRLSLLAGLSASLQLLGTPLASPARAQGAAPARKPLTAEAFDRWRSIRGERLSDDGRWVVYSLVPQVGDGEVVVRATAGAAEYRHTRGYIGRPQTRAGASGPNAAPTFPEAQLFADGRYVVFTIEPPRDSVERARREKRKPADQPRASLGIMSTATGTVVVVPGVKSFRPPRGAARWLAYLLAGADSAAKGGRDSAAAPAAAAEPGGAPRPIADSSGKSRKKKDPGSTLVLRDLDTGVETRIEDVGDVELDERGAWAAYTVSSRDGARDGAYLRSLADGKTYPLLTGAGRYKGITFDKAGTQVAWLSDREEYRLDRAYFRVYHASLASRRAEEIVGPRQTGADVRVSDRSRLAFSEDGRFVQLGVAPQVPDSIPADSLADKAVFDLWHWKDARLQPQQRVEAERDRGRWWAAAYDLVRRRYTLLGNDTLPRFRFSRDGRLALAVTDVPYAIESMWGEGGNDVYLVDVASGKRTLVARRVPFNATLSPDAKYVLWFGEDGRWHAYDVAAARTADLTGGLEGVRFAQETWDTPSTPAPWGVAGWTEGDRSVLLYDRWDIWEIDPAGRRSPRIVTDSLGRKRHLVFRYVELDTAERAIDSRKPLLLAAMDEETKASGFWRDRLGVAAAPESLLMADRRFGAPAKAKRADVLLFTRQSFTEFPDLWTSGMELRGATKLSNANPQQGEYRWGSAQLVSWRSADGVPLRGVLYKPEGFDPAKKYPMVVYFYEQLSDNLHQYQMSFPRNTVQPTHYVSHGYLAFFPDIAYTEGYPGPSAVKSVVPGVQMLLDSGFVKEDGVGLAGQSWGGYQVAYIITQTSLFRAGFAGAPVANMTSAYGGIRWQSGLARAFQYEKTQSRIGGSLWQYPMRFLENSPLFHADRVRTPLLIMHNDGDGAVPWYQGIELFVALRRLGKEVYLIDYNGDEHNPTKRANQQDIAMRMMQFFDHHLRGAPAPEWMQRGIPFLDKGRDQLATPALGGPSVTEQPAPTSKP
ncbi:MAG TPA: prolyl oligopeptidase family serine peptidase [Gemmatimonadaceae bacterium]|nr:prolyl oligopeptidase family serine peptidase [Gemmatimonadaceae bacterium]